MKLILKIIFKKKNTSNYRLLYKLKYLTRKDNRRYLNIKI